MGLSSVRQIFRGNLLAQKRSFAFFGAKPAIFCFVRYMGEGLRAIIEKLANCVVKLRKGKEFGNTPQDKEHGKMKSKVSKVAGLVLSGALATAVLTGCAGSGSAAKSVKLDPNNPTTITVWHYYNGAQQAAFDSLISEFNSTEGKDKGVYVEGYTHGSVSDLEKAVSDSAAGAVGSSELPNLFSSYADVAYSVQKEGKLADISEYISKDDLSQYVDSYVQEGYIDGSDALYLFPIAKSTEIMMVDKTDWDAFAEATGASLDELKTEEGIASVAKRYYEWTDAQTPDTPNDGKAFYGRDSMSNYFVIGMKQMGTDLFDVKDGKVVVNADKDKIRRLWNDYYVPYISGYYDSKGKFRSDDMKTGDVIAYTGSSSSATYFPSQVITEDGTKDIDYEVLSAPIMEGGENVYVQQGAGMAVTKSDDEHEYASCLFMKWFTQKENNLRFVSESGYLPVRKDANTMEALDKVIADNNLNISPKTYDCLKSILENFDSRTFYTSKTFDGAYGARKVLDYSLSDKAKADKQAVEQAIASGSSLEDAIAPYTSDAAFDEWYESFSQKLNEAASAS